MKKAEKMDLLKENNGLADYVAIFKHFFPLFTRWINEMIHDPRIGTITYSVCCLLGTFLLKAITGCVTMRHMNEMFSDWQVVENLSYLLDEDIPSMPDWQTCNDLFEKLKPEELEKLKVRMIKRLIMTKQYYKYTYKHMFSVILDGTGIAYFKERHCEHDLVTKRKDPETGEVRIYYYHKVLEAKLRLAPNLLISLGTEFIENESADVSKQDCELRAAYRLCDKIKSQFPHLNILIQGDSLYANLPFMHKISNNYHWHYLLNLKEGSQPTLVADFEYMCNHGDGETHEHLNIIPSEKGKIRFANHVETLSKKNATCNILEYTVMKDEQAATEKSPENDASRWLFITDLMLTINKARNLIPVGRGRWGIEEAFNGQKNNTFQIEHLCSKDPVAIKIQYLLIQIADIGLQLYLAYDTIVDTVRFSVKSFVKILLCKLREKRLADWDDVINRKTNLHLNMHTVPISRSSG